MTTKDDDEAARKQRAERLRRRIEELGSGKGISKPPTPREITDQAAEEELRKERGSDKEGKQ